jgi:putative ABC transport system permease protein
MTLRSTILRLKNLILKTDRDLHAELSSHLQLHIDDNLAKGMSLQQARKDALLKLGGLEQTKESIRDQQSLPLLESLLQDLRFALRLLKKSPTFTSVAILTLALGIGANTAIFSLLDQAIFRKLPVADPDRLVLVAHSGVDSGFSATRSDGKYYFSYPMYKDLRDRNSVFSGLLATSWTHVGVQWRKRPDVVDAELVSGNYFEVLGLQPSLGRLFVAADDLVPEANPVVVLSFDYWQSHLGSDPNIVNQSLLVNGHPFTVVGVTRPDFYGTAPGDVPALYLPMMMKPQVTPGWNDLDTHQSRWLVMFGRLKPGLDFQSAQAGLDPLWHSLRSAELPGLGHSSDRFIASFLTNSHMSLDPGAKGIPTHETMPTLLLIVMAMAALLVLMACTNIGTLLLVRAAARAREISVRLALGASRNRVARQLLAEGLFLGLVGALAGILLAPAISALLIRAIWADSNGALALSAHPDLRVLSFNFVLAFLVSILFSLAPIHQFWRPDLTPALQLRSEGASRRPLRLRRVLVAAQISLSLLLVVGAGLLVRTLQNLKSVPIGFASDHLVSFNINPLYAGYDDTRVQQLLQNVVDILSQLPGVRSVGATNDPELADTGHSSNVTVAGYHESEDEDMNVEWARIMPNFFAALNAPLLAGRDFTPQDRLGSQKVAIVNELFARRFFGDPQKAIGGYFVDGSGDVHPDIRIVGVSGAIRHTDLREEMRPAAYLPAAQTVPSEHPASFTFYVRTWQTPEAAEVSLREAIHVLDANIAMDKFRTMQEQIDDLLGGERVTAFLASSFGLLAAFMAAIGIYGLLAYATAQRTREFGIRLALGGTGASVIRIVVSEVLWLAGIGIAAGVPLALLCGQALRSRLFNVSHSDPLTLVLAAVAVTFVALAAAALPALRASKIDPIQALRYE